jgi:hypothetical protein
MGGQACILYGAAEFSRDADLAVLASAENLARLREAMNALKATVIAVPPFEAEYLDRGHAVHFECMRSDVRGMRIDIMSRLRGVDAFAALWARRVEVEPPDGETLDVLALPDLVAAKKTQRDKDWPMVRRLVDVDYVAGRAMDSPDAVRSAFWLRELRTPAWLIECASRFLDRAREAVSLRPLVAAALEGDEPRVAAGLAEEEAHERAADQAYWAPLRAELETLRHAARRPS